MIGGIAMQLIAGHLKSVAISYEEDIAKEDTELIKIAVLSGLLEMLADGAF